MAISNQAAIEKMISELQQALKQEQSGRMSKEHIRAVRLLCDLILDSEQAPVHASSDQELQKMIGGLESSLSKQAAGKKQSDVSTDKINHEEANGNSIFDF